MSSATTLLSLSAAPAAELPSPDSMEILSRLLASTRDCVKLLDLEGRILWMNPEGQERVGITNFKAVKGAWWPGDWASPYREMAERAVEEARDGNAGRFEGLMRTPSGEEIWWDVCVTAVPDQSGVSQCLLAVSRETTERKQAEMTLEAHKNHLQLIADHVPALMAYVDRERRYQWVNGAYETWYGLQPSELVGRDALELMKKHVGQAYADHLEPHITRALSGEKLCFEAVNDVRGVKRELQLTYAPDVAADGAVRGFVLQVTDLTSERQRQAELRASEQRFRTLAETLPSILWTAAPDGQIDYLSERFFELTGLEVESGLGGQWESVIHPDDRAELWTRWRAALQSGTAFEAQYRVKHRDLGYRWFLARALPQREESGEIERWVGVSTDVHDHWMAEEALRESESRYRLLFEDNPHPMWMYNVETLRFVAVNDTAVRNYGFSREEFLTMTVKEIRPIEDVPAVLERLRSLVPGKSAPVRHKRKDGAVLWVEVTSHPVSTPEGMLSFVLAQDVTERVRLEDELRRRAQHDSLTGAPNLALLVERFEQAKEAARKRNQKLAILAVDFDRFKHINDTFGHRIGDEFLKASVKRMEQALRRSDTVARTGGDEFAIIAGPVPSAAECRGIAERLLSVQRARMTVEDLELPSSISVGLAIYPDDGESMTDLMRRADYGLYQAKRSGRNCCRRYSAQERMGVQEAMQIERLLRDAAEEGRLLLHYQPQFGADGKVRMLEALLRMEDSTLGLVSPARFIPIAEESGAINALGKWVLNEVCRQMAAWRAEGRAPLPVAINVSAAQFARGDFAPEVKKALQEFGLEPNLLELELTESLLMEDLEQSKQQLGMLRSIGVSVAMDDFGTGYSSLSYLDALPLDTIKIDRSFIKNIGEGRSSAIVKAIVDLGRSVGLTVVAEGVETEEQRKELVRLSCDRLQGYLLAKPTPAAEVSQLLDGLAEEQGA